MVLVSKMQDIVTKKPTHDPNTHKPRSLNRVVRRNALIRIMHENDRILNRIVNAPATFNVNHWDDEHSKATGFLKNISKYPPPVRGKSSR